MAKEAQRYRILAEYASSRGYPQATAPRIQSWVKRHVLPNAIPMHLDFKVKVFAEPVETGRQLLALCHYRFDEGLRSIAQVGGLLWIDGFVIPDDVVRSALSQIGRLPVTLVERVAGQRFDPAAASADTMLAEVANSLVHRHHIAELFGVSPRKGLADGLADLLGVMLGVRSAQDVDLDAVDEVARLGRLDRARRERLPGITDPWLRERPAVALLNFATAFAPKTTAQRIAEASAEDLRLARASAQSIETATAAFADLASKAGQPEFAGLGFLPPGVSPTEMRLLAVLPALVFSRQARDLANELSARAHSG